MKVNKREWIRLVMMRVTLVFLTFTLTTVSLMIMEHITQIKKENMRKQELTEVYGCESPNWLIDING